MSTESRWKKASHLRQWSILSRGCAPIFPAVGNGHAGLLLGCDLFIDLPKRKHHAMFRRIAGPYQAGWLILGICGEIMFENGMG